MGGGLGGTMRRRHEIAGKINVRNSQEGEKRLVATTEVMTLWHFESSGNKQMRHRCDAGACQNHEIQKFKKAQQEFFIFIN